MTQREIFGAHEHPQPAPGLEVDLPPTLDQAGDGTAVVEKTGKLIDYSRCARPDRATPAGATAASLT